MITKLLLCTDGSQQALNATQLTANLAKRLGAEVLVVHVIDILAISAYTGPQADVAPPVGMLLEHEQEVQKEVLQHTTEVLETQGVSYTVFPEIGNPIESIVDLAQTKKVGTIVLGGRGLNEWEALLLGSISQGVVHHAHCPVLVVRGNPQELQRIVAATDGSEQACRALEVGAEVAKAFSTSLTVLNAVEPLSPQLFVPAQDVVSGEHEAHVLEAIEAQVAPILQGAGVDHTIQQEAGHPADAILAYTERENTDLVVLGGRGLGGFRRLLLGSVSDNVLRHATCSALIVR